MDSLGCYSIICFSFYYRLDDLFIWFFWKVYSDIVMKDSIELWIWGFYCCSVWGLWNCRSNFVVLGIFCYWNYERFKIRRVDEWVSRLWKSRGLIWWLVRVLVIIVFVIVIFFGELDVFYNLCFLFLFWGRLVVFKVKECFVVWVVCCYDNVLVVVNVFFVWIFVRK